MTVAWATDRIQPADLQLLGALREFGGAVTPSEWRFSNGDYAALMASGQRLERMGYVHKVKLGPAKLRVRFAFTAEGREFADRIKAPAPSWERKVAVTGEDILPPKPGRKPELPATRGDVLEVLRAVEALAAPPVGGGVSVSPPIELPSRVAFVDEGGVNRQAVWGRATVDQVVQHADAAVKRLERLLGEALWLQQEAKAATRFSGAAQAANLITLPEVGGD